MGTTWEKGHVCTWFGLVFASKNSVRTFVFNFLVASVFGFPGSFIIVIGLL